MARRSSSGCFNILKLFRRKKNEAPQNSNKEVEQQLRAEIEELKEKLAEIEELKEKLAEKERCLEETSRDLAILRNQFRFLESLHPTPGAKQTKKKRKTKKPKIPLKTETYPTTDCELKSPIEDGNCAVV